MKEFLPLTLLAACTPEYEERCPEETNTLEQACDNADVVGKNDNKELLDAVKRFKECTEDVYTVKCSDDGFTQILTVEKR